MRLFVCTAFAFLFACHPPAEVGSPRNPLQSSTASQCAAQCAQVGLPLDSIVIMSATVGCVCRAQAPGAPGASAAAAAGMQTVLDQQAAAAAEQQRSSSSTMNH